MLNTFINFVHMNGYGIYIWPAYLIVAALLTTQIWIPWRHYRAYFKKLSSHE